MEKFEDYLKELTDLVAELESGKLPLDEQITKYQRALELSKYCKQKLEDAKEVLFLKVDE